MLSERRARIPINYDLFAVYIDPGFEGSFAEALKAYCEQLGLPLRVEYTDYGVRGHSATNRENPCFLCARLRRKRLFEIADELGCRKLALGHNKDDMIAGLIRRFAGNQRFPDFENPCPTAKTSKRQEIKSLLKQLYRSNKKIKGNIFRAMSHVRLEYLLKS